MCIQHGCQTVLCESHRDCMKLSIVAQLKCELGIGKVPPMLNMQLLIPNVSRISFKTVAAITLPIFHGTFVLTFLLVSGESSLLEQMIRPWSPLLFFLICLHSVPCDVSSWTTALLPDIKTSAIYQRWDKRPFFFLSSCLNRDFRIRQHPLFHRQVRFFEFWVAAYQPWVNKVFDQYNYRIRRRYGNAEKFLLSSHTQQKNILAACCKSVR